MGARFAFDVSDPVLARAAWSRIAEPGDCDAGVLVRTLGPVAALEWLLGAAGVESPPRPAALETGGRELGGLVVGGGAWQEATLDLGDRAVGSGGRQSGEVARRVAGSGGREGGSGIVHVAPGEGVRKAVERWASRLENLDPRRELRVISRLGGKFLQPDDPQWPAGLDDLGDAAPLCLWVIGCDEALADLGAFLTPAVAVVGARAATRYGETITSQIVSGLVERDIAIVSGGAFGIDGMAHRAALGNHARTAAIMAGGVDRLYPAGNDAMLRQVAQVGAVLAEVPPGSAPRRERFLSRNRLIAALTSVTVVVEAGWRSGARNTASHAASLVRPVGAVPGPVTSAASAGCHRMVRDGIATLVTDAAEVIELAGPLQIEVSDDGDAGPRNLLDDLDQAERRVVDSLPARGSATLQSLVGAAGLPPRAIMAALGALERSGHVRRTGQAWTRAQTPAA